MESRRQHQSYGGLIRVMIVASLLLLVAGAGFLITGLIAGNGSFLIGAIVSSLMAAVCLYAGSRQRSRQEPEPRDMDVRAPRRDDDLGSGSDPRLAGRHAARRDGFDTERDIDDADPVTEPAAKQPPNQRSSRQDYLDIDVETEAVPSDEPAEVPMSSVEAAALMRMDAEVMVVDGRPRFHLGGCVHLVSRDAESLPAYEAVELGFTACSLCRPAQSLLEEPTRR